MVDERADGGRGGRRRGARAPPARGDSDRGNAGATAALIVGLLASQAVVRVALAVKSAAIPDVLSGKDLLQGNALSQAGGAFFQIVGIARRARGRGGASRVARRGLGARRARGRRDRRDAAPARQAVAHETTFAQEAKQVIGSIVNGVREVASRPAAAVGLTGSRCSGTSSGASGCSSSRSTRRTSSRAAPTARSRRCSGGVGLVGGVLGLLVGAVVEGPRAPDPAAARLDDLLGARHGRVRRARVRRGLRRDAVRRLLRVLRREDLGRHDRAAGDPDDFRGRAFALFDIAYNLGFIVPALILSFVWVENDPARTRTILLVSGAVFLALTAAVAAWARRIGDGSLPGRPDRGLTG